MKTVRIGLEWFLNPDHVPLLVGMEQGWFQEAGLEVELVAPDAHLDAFDAIEKGTLDLSITEPIHLLEDRAKGRDAVGFGRFLHTNGGVMVLENSGIERPRDLAAKRIQYPGAPGPGGPAIVSTMVEADGGTAENYVPVNYGFRHTDALAEGAADAAVLAFYNYEVIEARHRGHPARFFALKDWGVPDFCQLILTSSPRYIAANRSAVETLLSVVRRGIDYVHQHPDEARALYFRRTETDPEDALLSAIFAATVPCFTFDFDLSDAYFERLAQWMASRGLIDEVIPSGWISSLAYV